MRTHAEWRELLSSTPLPAAIIDLTAFDENAAQLAAIAEAAGKTVRLATKSIRVPALIARAVQSNPACFRGLMCYSASEIEYLSKQEPASVFDDFLLAYPTVQESDLAALARVLARGKRLTLVIDGRDTAQAAARVANLSGGLEPVRVIIDLDASLRLLGGAVHLGVRRSPVRTITDLDRTFAQILKNPALRCVGALSYEAQVAGLGDRNPFKKLLNPIAGWVRRKSQKHVLRQRADMRRWLETQDVKIELLNGGGTGSFDWAAKDPSLTELTAGSALYTPHLFDYYSNISFKPAAFFALQAVRSSDRGYVTCQGGGYIASGEPGWDRVPVPISPAGSRLVSTEGCGEVQTPVRLARLRAGEKKIHLGDPVIFRHAKAGELCERFNEVLLVQGSQITGRAPTYRGLGLGTY